MRGDRFQKGLKVCFPCCDPCDSRNAIIGLLPSHSDHCRYTVLLDIHATAPCRSACATVG